MNLPFDELKISQGIKQFKAYLLKIINCPILTYDELINTTGNLRGIYLIFDGNELIYIGMTANIITRLKDMTDYNRHSINKIYLSSELSQLIFKATNFVQPISSKVKNKLLDEKVLTKKEFNENRKIVNRKIKKLKFKFYETIYSELADLEHFAIAILAPIYND